MYSIIYRIKQSYEIFYSEVSFKKLITEENFMKKLTGLFLILVAFVISCASMQENAKKAACESACEESYEKCKKNAKKSKAKLAACETAKSKCLSDCN